MHRNFSKKHQTGLSPVVFISLILCLASGCTPYKTPEGSKPWSTILSGNQRTNVSEDVIALPAKADWTKDVSSFRFYDKFPDEQLSSPAIVEGAVYVGSTNNRFYSVNLDTGWVNWRFNAEFPLEAAPAVAGAYVCFGAGNGAVKCLDRATGKEAWSYQAKSEAVASPLIMSDRVIFYSADDKLTALDLKTGEKLWTYTQGTYATVAARVVSAPAASHENGRVYQLFTDGTLVCINVASGKAVWSKKIIGNFDSFLKSRRTPLVYGSNVYMIDGSNVILALDQETGELKNIFNVIKAYDFVIAGKRSIIIAGQDQTVAVDLVSGAILWKNDLKHNPMSSVFIAGDYLFVISNFSYKPLGIKWLARQRGYVEAFDLKTGETVWGKRLGSVITANAAASEGRIALLTDDGALQVFKSKK